MKIIRTNNTNADFKNLVRELDACLKTVDGEDHDFYNQYNGLEKTQHVVVAYDEAKPYWLWGIQRV